MSTSTCQRCGSTYEGAACALCGDTLLMQGDPLVGKVIAGRYRVLRKIGQGGMGAVYLAEQVGLGHKVALKFLNAQLLGRQDIAQRFLNEARSYARIAHPHAITFHDFGQDEAGNLYISMEYVEGPDLKALLAQPGGLPLGEAVEIVLQVADALEHAHAQGVIHRDLKPENVIVRQGMRGPHAKVLDFGIARLLGADATRLTIEGSIAGTPQYMPPEQVHGEDVDARADVYVLGIVLYELLTGSNPFVAASIPEMLFRQSREPLPGLPDGNLAAVDAVIQRATAKAKDERFPSMAAFAAALIEATQTPGYAAALQTAAPATGTGSAAGGTWVRGPGARLHRPITPAVEPVRSGTALGYAGEPSQNIALELPQVEAPPPSRTARRGGGWGKGAALLLLAGGATAFLLLQLPDRPAPAPTASEPPAAAAAQEAHAEDAPADEAPADEAPADEAPAVEAPPPAAPPAVVPAAATEKAVAVPADQRLREQLLAREIWLKANAEFLAGNLGSAREILATVPAEASTRERVEELQARIDRLEKQLREARALAARGDCHGAIDVYDRILRAYPHARDAATERARCARMLPPSLAE